ncbi:MAG: SRPBCC family protein [Flavobacteriales bacterium]|nr:SRPBCC family protein [Flavobacteriales bacterium]
MTNVSVTKSINVSANDAWAKLAAFGGIEHFSPIEKSITEGEGVGAKRTCIMPDGAEINEVLNKLDNDNMHLEYEILTGPFPMTDYISDVNVKVIDAENCEITWSSNFNPNEGAEDQMNEILNGFYNTMIDGLETLIKQN